MEKRHSSVALRQRNPIEMETPSLQQRRMKPSSVVTARRNDRPQWTGSKKRNRPDDIQAVTAATESMSIATKPSLHESQVMEIQIVQGGSNLTIFHLRPRREFLNSLPVESTKQQRYTKGSSERCQEILAMLENAEKAASDGQNDVTSIWKTKAKLLWNQSVEEYNCFPGWKQFDGRKRGGKSFRGNLYADPSVKGSGLRYVTHSDEYHSTIHSFSQVAVEKGGLPILLDCEIHERAVELATREYYRSGEQISYKRFNGMMTKGVHFTYIFVRHVLSADAKQQSAAKSFGTTTPLTPGGRMDTPSFARDEHESFLNQQRMISRDDESFEDEGFSNLIRRQESGYISLAREVSARAFTSLDNLYKEERNYYCERRRLATAQPNLSRREYSFHNHQYSTIPRQIDLSQEQNSDRTDFYEQSCAGSEYFSCQEGFSQHSHSQVEKDDSADHTSQSGEYSDGSVTCGSTGAYKRTSGDSSGDEDDGENGTASPVDLRVQSSKKSWRGMVNLRSYCYVNAVMQLLASMPVSWLDSWQYTDGPITKIFLAILLGLKKKSNLPIDPTPLFATLRKMNRQYTGETQEDAIEFLLFIFDEMEKELIKEAIVHLLSDQDLDQFAEDNAESVEETRILAMKTLLSEKGAVFPLDDFRFQIQPILTCQTCGHSWDSMPEVRILFQLDLPECSKDDKEQSLSVSELFHRHFQAESGVTCHCKKCGANANVSKSHTIISCPKYALVEFKRYVFIQTDENTPANGQINCSENGPAYIKTKKKTPVHFGADAGVQLGRYCLNPPQKGYEMLGWVQHQGFSLDNGHYIARAAREGDKSKLREWFEFDDAIAKPVVSSSMVAPQPEVIAVLYIQNEDDLKPKEKSLIRVKEGYNGAIGTGSSRIKLAGKEGVITKFVGRKDQYEISFETADGGKVTKNIKRTSFILL